MPTLTQIADRSVAIAESDRSMAPAAFHALRHLPVAAVRPQFGRIIGVIRGNNDKVTESGMELLLMQGALPELIQEIRNTEPGSELRASIYTTVGLMLRNAEEYHKGLPQRWKAALQSMNPDIESQCRQLPGSDEKSVEGFSFFVSFLPLDVSRSGGLIQCLHTKAATSREMQKSQLYFAAASVLPDRVSVRNLAEAMRENREEHIRSHLTEPLAQPDARNIARDYYLSGFHQNKDAALKLESALALRKLGRAVAAIEGSSFSMRRNESRNAEDEAFQDKLLALTEDIQPDREFVYAAMQVYKKPPDFKLEVRDYLRRILLRYEGPPVAGLVPLLFDEFEGGYKYEKVLEWNRQLPVPHKDDTDIFIKNAGSLHYLLALGKLPGYARPKIRQLAQNLSIPFPHGEGEAYEAARDSIDAIGLESQNDIQYFTDFIEKNRDTNLSNVEKYAFILGSASDTVDPSVKQQVIDTLWLLAKEGRLGRLIAADSIYRIDPSQKEKLIDYYIDRLKNDSYREWNAAYYLGKFGPDAKRALPVLRSVDKPDYAQEAAALAVKRIQQQ